MTREPQDTDLLWVDLETTGLDEQSDLLLEVGFIVTDADLIEVARASWVIPWRSPRGHLDSVRTMADPAVRDMHDANGLWVEAGVAGAFDGRAVTAWVTEHAPTATLAGSSIGQFDVRWLREWLPGVLDGRTHRVADISSLREYARRWAPQLVERVEAQAVNRKIHRVIPDLEDSIALARAWREALRLNGTILTHALGGTPS